MLGKDVKQERAKVDVETERERGGESKGRKERGKNRRDGGRDPEQYHVLQSLE